MDRNLSVSKSIDINAQREKVWDALTNPEKMSVYLFGTETITDWQVGSPIVFQGEYDGHVYKDKGNVLENRPNELLKYNYWAQYSGLEDKLANYSIVTYEIEKSADDRVTLTWTQEGFANEEGQKHTESTLYEMLEQIKNLVEEG